MRAGIALMMLVFGAAPAAAETNWGIREVGKPVKQANNEPLPAGTTDPTTWDTNVYDAVAYAY